MARASRAEQEMARQLRIHLEQLTEDLVARIQEAALPGYEVFARPVLEQSARQLFEALIASLETGNITSLAVYAEDQGSRRRQQGVSAQALGQVAGMFRALVRDVAEASGAKGALQAVDLLLDAFADAFTAGRGRPHSNTVSVTRSGGMRMTDRPENDISYGAVLQQLRYQARQLETSARVSRRLTAALDLDDLLPQVVELIKSDFDYYHVHAYLLDVESGYLIMREGTGQAGKTLKSRGHRIELGQGIVGRVGQTGEPLLVPDVTREPDWLPNDLLPETKSELTVPLKIGDGILGVLDVQSSEVDGLTQADLKLMESLARQIALAVENAILFRETQTRADMQRLVEERTEELSALQGLADHNAELLAELDRSQRAAHRRAQQLELSAGVAEQLTANLDLHELLSSIVDLIQQSFDYYYVCLYLADESSGDLVLMEGTGEPGTVMKERRHRIAVGDEIVGAAAATGQTILLWDVNEVDDWRPSPLLPDTKAELSVPFKIGDRVLGVLDVHSNEAGGLTDDDQALLEGLGGQIAVAVQNAHIFSEIEHQVETRTREVRVFQSLAENAADAIAMADLSGKLFYVNAAWYALYGRDPDREGAIGESVDALWPQDAIEWTKVALDRPSSHGWRGEVGHWRGDKTSVTIDLTLFVVRDDRASPIAVAALGRDITIRKMSSELTRLVSTASSQSELGVGLLRAVLWGMKVDAGSFVIYECQAEGVPRTARIVATYDQRKSAVVATDQSEPFEGNPIHAELCRVREPIVYNDLAALDQGRRAAFEGFKFAAALPLTTDGGQVCGALLLQRKRDLPFAEEIEFLVPVLQQVSLAVTNLILREAQEREAARMLDQRTAEMRATTQVAQAIASTLGLDELFWRVVQLVKEQFGYHHLHVYLVSTDESGLELVAGHGEPGRLMKETRHRVPMGQGLVGVAAASGEPVLAEDVSQVDNWLPSPFLPDTKSEVAVPIKMGDRVLGVLDVQDDRIGGLDRDTQVLLQGLCGQIAIAIEHTRLLEEMQASYDDVARLASTVRELSSPVIQVWDDVLVVPLVGAIDSRRALSMMEALLTGITSYQAEQVIIDITGVPVMDTSVANHLLQTIKAASLLGAKCMLVGISSEMAQTIVGLGLDLSSVATYSNLRAGIQAALRSAGYAIARISPDGGEKVS